MITMPSAACGELVSHFESYSEKAYPETLADKSVVWSVGFGSRYIMEGGSLRLVREGDNLTRVQATVEMSRHICEDAWKNLKDSLPADFSLEQNEVDALSSFIYNLGGGTWRKSSILKLLLEKKKVQAADRMLAYNVFAGKIAGGLVKRRAAEHALFFGRTVTAAIAEGEQAYTSWRKAREPRVNT